MGEFLADGENTHLYREDFVGVIADEHIPEWAKAKLEQRNAPNEGQETAPENDIQLNM